MNVEDYLSDLEAGANLRRIPSDMAPDMTDFTSNDYLGFAADTGLRERFFATHSPARLAMSASASRLLAASQHPYANLEKSLGEAYGRHALLFNSGYHANTGIIPAIADRASLILADRLVHASIIDGIRLSGARFTRFPHNDFDRLERLIEANVGTASTIIVIVESIYSMDGDRADLKRLADLKRRFPEIILYVDEAHAVGAIGPAGLGESVAQGVAADIDVIVGTFGKALASAGAFAVTSEPMRSFLINRARPFIFSTALSPAQILWSDFVWRHSLGADSARDSLARKSRMLADIIPGGAPSHIRPLIVGDARRAVDLSERLRREGFNVLPIRTPTVPPGTERLRFSLSAAIPDDEITRLGHTLSHIHPINS